MTLTYTAGSLVSARGRDWVVLPESAADMLVLRPLGGADDDIAAVFPAFEEVRRAEFAPPVAGRPRRRSAPPACCAPPCASASAPAPARSARSPGSPSSPAPTSSSRC